MKVRVDPTKCQGHNRCYSLVADLFEVDDYGLSKAVGEGNVPAHLEDRALLAADNCPEFAIEIIEED